MHRKRNGGLSLVDVLIVLVTLAVIAVLVVPQYNEKKAREHKEMLIQQARADLLSLKLAQEKYFESNGRFASAIEDLVPVEPTLRQLARPYGDDSYHITLVDTTQFSITTDGEDAGVVEAGVPSWLGDPGSETIRAELIKRSRRRMEKVNDAQLDFFESRGIYADDLDSLEAIRPGVKNMLCSLMMKPFSIVMPDSGMGYEITSHLDEVGSIVNGEKEYPPLPKPKVQ